MYVCLTVDYRLTIIKLIISCSPVSCSVVKYININIHFFVLKMVYSFQEQQHWASYLMITSLAISTSSPSMFQGKAAPSDWMMGEVLESPSSSLSSSNQPVSARGRILTADTACASTKEKLNCRETVRRTDQSGDRGLCVCVCVCVSSQVKDLLRMKMVFKQLVYLEQWLGFFLFTIDCCLNCRPMKLQQGAAKTRRETDRQTVSLSRLSASPQP